MTHAPPHAPAHTRSATPPPTRRDDHVDRIDGHEVADPYRWLEDGNDPDVRAWIAAQTAAADAHVHALPARHTFRDRLAELWDHPRRSAPWRRGDAWFQLRNDGLQDQDVLWTAPATDDATGLAPDDDRWQVLVDPNTWSDDGTAALAALAPTDDGARIAVARSDAGSDWMTWRIVDVATGDVHEDVVPWAKFCGATWLPDGSGFVYGAYQPPAEGQEHAAATRQHRLLLHRLGTPAEDDELVYERPDRPEWLFAPAVSHDGRWLVVQAQRGTHPLSHVHVAPIEDGRVGEMVPLLDRGDASYDHLGVLGGELLLLTDRDAPLGRVVAVPLPDPAAPGAGTHDTDGEQDGGEPADAPLREVVAETADRLEAAQLVGGATDADPVWLVCRRLHHATARLEVLDGRTGDPAHLVDLPGPGTVATLTGGRNDRAVHLTYETFTAPAAIVHHDLATATTSVVTPAPGPGDDHLVTEQVRVHHDGVGVPLFLVHRGDVAPDGRRPTLLWGYGGFDIAITPTYRAAWRAWVDAGGVLAVACLRGGGEYGRAWHDAGRLGNKQHVFDDALACAAWLTGRRRDDVRAEPLTDDTDTDAVWTAPEHLGIEGRSNGGLLVGACMTQEPDAFGSAVPEVGVLDVTRFHRFTIGWAWTSDYGDPDDPDDLATILGYSPYHRVEEGARYPATLVTTGDTDDRVVPLHSYKFAAAVQHAQAGDAPVLLRVDIAAGHGAGKPVGKLVEERADVLAFHAHHLGLHVDDRG